MATCLSPNESRSCHLITLGFTPHTFLFLFAYENPSVWVRFHWHEWRRYVIHHSDYNQSPDGDWNVPIAICILMYVTIPLRICGNPLSHQSTLQNSKHRGIADMINLACDVIALSRIILGTLYLSTNKTSNLLDKLLYILWDFNGSLKSYAFIMFSHLLRSRFRRVLMITTLNL